MTNTLTDYDRFEQESPHNRQLLREEDLILEVTEVLSVAMEEEGINKTQLAQRLGKSKGFVSQLLSGGRNLTLRTIANVADALGYRVQIRLAKNMEQNRPTSESSVEPFQISGISLSGSAWDGSPTWKNPVPSIVGIGQELDAA